MKDDVKNMLGVCSQCQTSGHELERLPSGHLVLAEHELCGERCKGSGMSPETTYKK